MNTSSPQLHTRFFICICIGLIVALSFIIYYHYPAEVLSGENSVGTWLSIFMLSGCTTLSLIIGMQRLYRYWWTFSIFFTVLALDERFMFHENLKQHILFSSGNPEKVPFFIAEFPVLAAMLVGGVVAFLMWKHTILSSRVLLLAAVFIGSVSVILDVTNIAIFLEDICKLAGELLLFVYLLGEVCIEPEQAVKKTEAP